MPLTTGNDFSVSHPPWWNDAGLRKLNFFLTACFISAIANGYVSSLMASLITNPQWYKDIPGVADPTLLGVIVAAQPLGCIIAFPIAPSISDGYGRKMCIMFGNICMTVWFIGQVFS